MNKRNTSKEKKKENKKFPYRTRREDKLDGIQKTKNEKGRSGKT